MTACRGDDELVLVLKSDCELDLSVLKREGRKDLGNARSATYVKSYTEYQEIR